MGLIHDCQALQLICRKGMDLEFDGYSAYLWLMINSGHVWIYRVYTS